MSGTIILMVIQKISIVAYNNHSRIVFLSVIVKGIKEDSNTIPLISCPKNRTFHALLFCKPDCQSISSNAASSCNSKGHFNFPIFKY